MILNFHNNRDGNCLFSESDKQSSCHKIDILRAYFAYEFRDISIFFIVFVLNLSLLNIILKQSRR